jgi:histone demethylase JARID1
LLRVINECFLVFFTVNGINVPWLYYGSLFTTFCWHNEDNYLYSINYHHRGAPKQWYGVPGGKKHADGLEKVFKNFLSMKMRDAPDLLHHITTMFNPRLLQNADVPVYKLLQHEGEFIITFPRSFHGGFSLGPNVGEAVNFAPHDWIAYGADANERYRSFARPAVFSHDRLTFTMSNHLREQKAYSTCKLLLDEIERVVGEELRLREKLSESGVRDVSGMISLPRNRLDQLDAESADYDDKRLCHACKHVCFFSAVACECSQSKVSCLRHSHYMCRCPTERKYFMVWSDENELKSTLQRVRDHCESLKKMEEASDLCKNENIESGTKAGVAQGAEEDLELHKDDEITTAPVTEDIRNVVKHADLDLTGAKTMRSKMCMGGPAPDPTQMLRRVSHDASGGDNSSDDDVQIVGVKAPTA